MLTFWVNEKNAKIETWNLEEVPNTSNSVTNNFYYGYKILTKTLKRRKVNIDSYFQGPRLFLAASIFFQTVLVQGPTAWKVVRTKVFTFQWPKTWETEIQSSLLVTPILHVKPHVSWPTAPAKRTWLSVDQALTYGKYFIVKTQQLSYFSLSKQCKLYTRLPSVKELAPEPYTHLMKNWVWSSNFNRMIQFSH